MARPGLPENPQIRGMCESNAGPPPEFPNRSASLDAQAGNHPQRGGADVNGDGADDLVAFRSPGWGSDVFVALSHRTGFGPSIKRNGWFWRPRDEVLLTGKLTDDFDFHQDQAELPPLRAADLGAFAGADLLRISLGGFGIFRSRIID
jgi:hypothetical protein